MTAETLEIPASSTADIKPSSMHTALLTGIFVLLLLYSMHIASEIVIPVVLAFILKLVFNPVFRAMEKARIPRIIAAGSIILLLLGVMLGMGTALSGPAVSWAEKLPDSYPQLQKRMSFVTKPMAQTEKILVKAEDITQSHGTKIMPVTMQQNRLSDRVLSGIQALIGGMFTMLLVLFFLMASGDTFLRRLVEVLPRFKDKRQAVDISQQIETDVSSYLLTITVMNAGVGVATTCAMWAFRVEDPLLWGALAFFFNYVPVMGAMICASLFLLVGLIEITGFWQAFMPTATYLLIHMCESSFITPLLLARRFTLNPVLVILSVIFWYWMWGVPGVILAMPMLAIAKIICDRIERFSALGHFMGGEKIAKIT